MKAVCRVRVPKSAYIVRDLALELVPGTLVFLSGPNGSGKSTALNRISASCRGRDQLEWVPGPPVSVLHIPQNAAEMLHPLFPVRRFVRDFFGANGLDGASSMAALGDVLRQLGIPHAATLLDKYPSQLSGGQRQRLLFGMTLLWTGELVVLDEALSNLPPGLRIAGYDLLRSRLDGRCAVIVSHDRSVVRREEGDRIVEL